MYEGNNYLQCSKGVISNLDTQELIFLYFARYLVVQYISVKFHENIANGFQVTESARVYDRNHYRQCSKDYQSESRKTKVVVLVFACVVSLCFIFFKVFRKSLSQTIFNLWTGHEFVTGRWTDGQTGRRKSLCLPTLKGPDMIGDKGVIR